MVLDKGLNSSIEYLKTGSTIGVKARVKMENDKILLIGEKITFINTRNEDN